MLILYGVVQAAALAVDEVAEVDEGAVDWADGVPEEDEFAGALACEPPPHAVASSATAAKTPRARQRQSFLIK